VFLAATTAVPPSCVGGRLTLDGSTAFAPAATQIGRAYHRTCPGASISADDREQEVQLTQTEAQLLQDAKDYQGAYAVLSAALAGEPDSADLLYDVAMVAEKLNRIDEVESRLKRVIELKPDNAQALNALGYTLVDRTKSVAEGTELIERAIAAKPDSYAIQDSMGWALVQSGRLDDGRNWLLIKHRDEWSGDVDITEFAPKSVKSEGDFEDILAADAPDIWISKGPTKGGEASKMLADIVEKAAALKAGREKKAPVKRKKR